MAPPALPVRAASVELPRPSISRTSLLEVPLGDPWVVSFRGRGFERDVCNSHTAMMVAVQRCRRLTFTAAGERRYNMPWVRGVPLSRDARAELECIGIWFE